MRKLILVTLALIPSFCYSETYHTKFNPFTGRLDYVTTVTSSTLPSGSTQYIQNTNSLQSGSTFHVSSGSVQGPFYSSTQTIRGGGIFTNLLSENNGTNAKDNIFSHDYSDGSNGLRLSSRRLTSAGEGAEATFFATETGGSEAAIFGFSNLNGKEVILNGADAVLVWRGYSTTTGFGSGSDIAKISFSDDHTISLYPGAGETGVNRVRVQGGLSVDGLSKNDILTGINLFQAVDVGNVYYCTDCTYDTLVIATGTTQGAFAKLTDRKSLVDTIPGGDNLGSHTSTKTITANFGINTTSITVSTINTSAGVEYVYISTSLTVPGTGANSEHFGNQSTAAGARGVSLGYQASADATQGVAIGYGAIADTTSDGVAVGTDAQSLAQNAFALGSQTRASGVNSISVGRAATSAGAGSVSVGAAAVTDSGGPQVAMGSSADTSGSIDGIAVGNTAVASAVRGIAIGNGASAGHSSFVFGVTANSTANGQFIAGDENNAITNVFFSEGVVDASPVIYTMNGTGGSGTDIAGGTVTIAGGKGTGNSTSGDIIFQTSDAGASGTTLQSLTTKVRIDNLGNIRSSAASNYIFSNSGSRGVYFVANPLTDAIGSQYITGTPGGGVELGTLGDPVNVIQNDATEPAMDFRLFNGGATVIEGIRLKALPLGTPGPGFGSVLRYQAGSTTTNYREVATVEGIWADATDATRKGEVKISVYDGSTKVDMLDVHTSSVNIAGRLNVSTLTIANANIFVSTFNVTAFAGYALYLTSGTIAPNTSVTISTTNMGVGALGLPICAELENVNTAATSVRTKSLAGLPNSFTVYNADIVNNKDFICYVVGKPL